MKRTKIAGCLGAIAMSLSSSAWSLTGNDIMKWLPEYENQHSVSFNSGVYIGYVSGVADATRDIIYCPKGSTTNGQNGAVVAKWLRKNPERWGEDATTLIMSALRDSYPKCKSS